MRALSSCPVLLDQDDHAAQVRGCLHACILAIAAVLLVVLLKSPKSKRIGAQLAHGQPGSGGDYWILSILKHRFYS